MKDSSIVTATEPGGERKVKVTYKHFRTSMEAEGWTLGKAADKDDEKPAAKPAEKAAKPADEGKPEDGE